MTTCLLNNVKTAVNELMEEFHIEHLRDSMGQSLSGVNVAV